MKCHLIKISVTIILLGLVAVGGFLYKKSFIDITVQDKFFNENRGKLSGSVNSANFPALQDSLRTIYLQVRISILPNPIRNTRSFRTS